MGLQHIFDLCNNNDNIMFSLDVRSRATMYQRLLKYDINAAKKIVLSRNIISDFEKKSDLDHDKFVNNKIDNDLCRLSGIYNKSEKEFVYSQYLPLNDIESDDDEESSNEYHSSDDDQNNEDTEHEEDDDGDVNKEQYDDFEL